MLEPWRSHYLHALGIDVYLPRVILPGAKPSTQCEWDLPAPPETPAQAETDISPIDDIDAARGAAPEFAARAAAAAPEPPTGARMPVLDEPRAQRREPRATPAPRPSGSAAIPRFAFSVVSTDGALVVDEAPPGGAARADYLRLLGNLLFALNGGNAKPALDVFIWPMVKNPQIDQSADAAREALAAYLQKQVHNRAIRTVLLLGENAQHWLAESARRQLGATCAVSVSAWPCLRDAAAKRRLWRDLRHLAAPESP